MYVFKFRSKFHMYWNFSKKIFGFEKSMTQSVKYQLYQTNEAKYFVKCNFLTSHSKLLPKKLQQTLSSIISFAIIAENSKYSYQKCNIILGKESKEKVMHFWKMLSVFWKRKIYCYKLLNNSHWNSEPEQFMCYFIEN